LDNCIARLYDLKHCIIFLGGCCGSTRRTTVVGGWAWAWWLITDVQYLSLEVIVIIGIKV